jgi:hypothetical protein
LLTDTETLTGISLTLTAFHRGLRSRKGVQSITLNYFATLWRHTSVGWLSGVRRGAGTLLNSPCLTGNADCAPGFELYPGIRLTTEEKSRKDLSQGSRKVPAGYDSISRYVRTQFVPHSKHFPSQLWDTCKTHKRIVSTISSLWMLSCWYANTRALKCYRIFEILLDVHENEIFCFEDHNFFYGELIVNGFCCLLKTPTNFSIVS